MSVPYSARLFKSERINHKAPMGSPPAPHPSNFVLKDLSVQRAWGVFPRGLE